MLIFAIRKQLSIIIYEIMKRKLFLYATAVTAILAFTACSDRDDNFVNIENLVEEGTDELIPTADLMSVRVMADLPTAVLQPFDEGSTGEALVKRLPTTTATIEPDTRMVLLPGSVFDLENKLSEEEITTMVQKYMEGGYIAIERPTQKQMAMFGLVFLTKALQIEMDQAKTIFDISEEEAEQAVASSPTADRIKARMANIQRVAQPRAGSEDLDAVWAEMVVMGPTDYFLQEPYMEETTAYIHSDDGEGNATEPETVTGKQERTPYISGTLADAAAEWLNITEKKSEKSAKSHHYAMRANGSSAINELMDASETFTFNGAIDWRNWSNKTRHYANRVNIKVSSWGIHNMESNKDYYYMKQNVTLRMGNGIYYARPSDIWVIATNYGIYNRWFGSFLSQYETSMDLMGNGSITLEAAAPTTDNNTSTTNITTGSSHSTTETIGVSWGSTVGASASGPMSTFSLGGSSSIGTTNGTSFSVSNSQSHKDLGVKKNTSGNKVTWTYTGTIPVYYVWRDDKFWHPSHQTPADILVNDCDVAEEICWSVANPSDQYTVNITSAPQTAALVYQYQETPSKNGDFPAKHEYTTTPTENYSHQLLMPNRAMQSWRMLLTVDEWEDARVAGAESNLAEAIRRQFPDLYASQFSVADKTSTSLNTISYVVNYIKGIFQQNYDILQSLAKDYGVAKFTIHWRCDDRNVTTRQGFTVRQDCSFKATDGTHNIAGCDYNNIFDGNASTIWCTSQRRNGVYFVEFQSSRLITPTAYTLITGAYTSSYPGERPKHWRVMAKKNAGDEWTTIATVTGDTRLPDQSGQSAKYDLDITGRQWQYFRLEVSATQGSNKVNIGDFEFDF